MKGWLVHRGKLRKRGKSQELNSYEIKTLLRDLEWDSKAFYMIQSPTKQLIRQKAHCWKDNLTVLGRALKGSQLPSGLRRCSCEKMNGKNNPALGNLKNLT